MTTKSKKDLRSLLEGSRNNAEIDERQAIALETIAECLIDIRSILKNRK